MSDCSHIVLMASYNEWMNAKVYEATGRLGPHEITQDRGAFFGSILGTLNHIAVADTIWLKRFSAHQSRHAALDAFRELSAPAALDTLLFTELSGLHDYRKMLDSTIRQWAAQLTEHDLKHALPYATMKGVPANRRFSSLVMHFFNHQTHHRGQATTLLFQAGQDVGVTDLIALIPDEAPTPASPATARRT